MPGERIELPTNGLQNRCSTAELTRQSHIVGFDSWRNLDAPATRALSRGVSDCHIADHRYLDDGRPPFPAAPSGANAFVCLLEVADFDGAATTILANGGQTALPKFTVPERCWQGCFLDPGGSVFGIFEVDESAA